MTSGPTWTFVGGEARLAGGSGAEPFCAFRGELANCAQLSAELGSGASDAEALVVAAHRRWGRDMVGRLRGRFALVLWDPGSRSGILAVDRLGVYGLFLHERDSRLSFAFELRDLVRALPNSPGPSGVGVSRWLADGLLPAGSTLYEGVRRLDGGEAVVLSQEGWRSFRYWRPQFDPLQLTRAEAVEAVRTSSEHAVGSRLRGRTGVLLSGGIDSASVAAFTVRARSGAKVPTYSVVFPERPSMNEDGLIKAVTAHLGLAGGRLAFERGSMLAASLEYLEAWSVPSVSPNLVVHLPLLRHAAQEGVAAILDGQGGDELFGCAHYLLADRVRHGRFRSAVRLAGSLPGAAGASRREALILVWHFGLKGAAPHHAHTLVALARGGKRRSPPWLRPDAASLADGARDRQAWKRLAGPRWWAERVDELIGGRVRMGAHDFLRHKNELVGLEGRHPFLDDPGLVELALSLPPELSFDAHYDRPLLRAAVEGLVPDEVRLRPDKSYFNELFRDTLSGPDWPAVRTLLDGTSPEVSAYVRPELVRSLLLDAPANRRSGYWAWAVWRLATVECWLRYLADPGLPRRTLDRLSLEAPRYTFSSALIG